MTTLGLIAQSVSPILGSWLVFIGMALIACIGLWLPEWMGRGGR